MSQLKKLLKKLEGSDLHLISGLPPLVRQNGQIRHIEDDRPLAQSLCEEIGRELLENLSKEEKAYFLDCREVLFAYQGENKDRYRVHLHWRDHHIKMHFRLLPFLIPQIEQLGLPKNIIEVAKYTEGMILISGPMNSGRSTTAMSFMQYWNQNRSFHLVTLEKVLEYCLSSNKSLIDQRIVPKDREQMVTNLLKQDIDGCFFADVHEPQEFTNLLDICKGGGLVLSTTFATSTRDAIEQFIGYGRDSHWKASCLSSYLKAIIYQRLLPGLSGQPVLIAEVFLPTLEIRQLIKKQDLDSIHQLMRKDQHRTGMTSFNQSLLDALIKRKIELRTAFLASSDPKELDQLLKKVGI